MISVKLRDLQEKDKVAVKSMLGDPQVMAFIGPRRALTDNEADLWFQSALDTPSRFVIANAESDEFIGFCGVKEINGVLDFGYFIRSECWGKGIAVAACELAIEKLVTKFDLDTVQVFIAEDNIASKRVAEKLGWLVLNSATKDGEYGQYYRIIM